MSKLTIFDADSIVFTVAWSFRTKKATNLVKLNTNKFISDVLVNSGADDYIGFYASKEDGFKPNFRYAIDPKYKANRPPTPDFVIKWGPTIRKVFKDGWGFVPVEGMEADDAVAIAVEQYRDKYDEITVATFDKDLRQIPNVVFYNMRKHTMEKIENFDALKNFYIQMLMGDSTDNIKAIAGIGKVGARKILKECTTEYSLFRATVNSYVNYETNLRKKEQAALVKEIKDEIVNTEAKGDKYTGIYAGLSTAKLDRKIRINTAKQLKDIIEAAIPGGWKKYFFKQYALLKMLTEPHDDLDVPDVQESPVKELVKEKIKRVEKRKAIDDFLTI